MLKFTPKEVCLKNGKTVLIRQAELVDADDLLQCVKNYIPTSDYVPKLEQEIKLTVAQEVNWIHSFLKNDNSLLLVAEFDELGLNLYRKMGFIENGIIKNFFKKDNQYFDNLTMSMNVKN